MQIKKVLLIVPPAVTLKFFRDINPLPPLGLGYLASVIKELGIGVEILDALMLGWGCETEFAEALVRVGLSDEEIKRQISASGADIIGISCQFSRQYKIYHRLFSLIKEIKPDVITIAGGAHVTACPEEVLSDPNCDFILSGEAEDSFKDFILRLTQDEDVTVVDGLGWKDKGRLQINKKSRWIKDLDSVPYPAYDIMKLDKYFGLKSSHGLRHKDKFSPIVTSRGCPSKCTFCSAYRVWGNNFRFRSVDNVLKEMKHLKDKYGVEEIMFEDDNVTANPKRAEDLFLQMIHEKFNFTWDTPNGVGVWVLNERIIDLMKQSGCIQLNFPVESGSQRVLDNIIKKPVKLSKIKALIKYCRKINLSYGLFLVMGLPGETLKDIWKSFHFAADCGCYSPFISIATPYPGTELFDNCKKNNHFSRKFSFDDLYIKSYMIKTKDWDEDVLKKVFLRGCLYLAIRNALAHPLVFCRKYLRKLFFFNRHNV